MFNMTKESRNTVNAWCLSQNKIIETRNLYGGAIGGVYVYRIRVKHDGTTVGWITNDLTHDSCEFEVIHFEVPQDICDRFDAVSNADHTYTWLFGHRRGYWGCNGLHRI